MQPDRCTRAAGHRGAGIELNLVCEAEPLTVRADAGQLREVLRQLLANAVEIKRAFHPFYSTKFQRRGRGLSAVLGIVRSHRGALQIESDPQHGTTVRALLPLAQQPSEETPCAGSARICRSSS